MCGYRLEVDEETKRAIRDILSELENPVRLTLYRGKFCEWSDVNWCDLADQLLKLLQKLAPAGKLEVQVRNLEEDKNLQSLLEPHITSRVKVPVICLDNCTVIFLGAPFGEEVKTFLDAVLLVSKRRTNLNSEVKKELKEIVSKLPRKLYIVTLVTQMCPYCPYAATLSNSFAVESEGKIVSIVYDASLDPELAEEYGITMVPAIIMGLEGFKGRLEFIGVPSEQDLLERIKEHLKLGR